MVDLDAVGYCDHDVATRLYHYHVQHLDAAVGFDVLVVADVFADALTHVVLDVMVALDEKKLEHFLPALDFVVHVHVNDVHVVLYVYVSSDFAIDLGDELFHLSQMFRVLLVSQVIVKYKHYLWLVL